MYDEETKKRKELNHIFLLFKWIVFTKYKIVFVGIAFSYFPLLRESSVPEDGFITITVESF